MNKEIYKQLKNAGFPQSLPDENLVKTDDGELINPKDISLIPTLEELIEACGEFSSLTKSPRGTWYCATSVNGNVELAEDIECKSPLEAVAKLYLKLNE